MAGQCTWLSRHLGHSQGALGSPNSPALPTWCAGWVQLQPVLRTCAAAAVAAAANIARKRARESESDGSDVEARVAAEQGGGEAPAWKAALARGSHFCIPTRPAGGGPGAAPPAPPAWTFPATAGERQRYAVYSDLLSRG